MTEREYIDTTNLAKLRAARVIVYDTLNMDEKEKNLRQAALEAMRAWEEKLEKVVRTRR